MKSSYFILHSLGMDYPLYVAFSYPMSVADINDMDILWIVVFQLTGLSRSDFDVVICSCDSYESSLIKLDFTLKQS